MGEGRKRTQITLKSLVNSTSFIGAGIGCYLAGRSYLSADPKEVNWRAVAALLQILGSVPLIGAGILLPFGRARLGAYAGFFLFLSVALGYDTYHFGWRTLSQSPVDQTLAAGILFAVSMAAMRGGHRIWRRRSKLPVSDGEISN